MTELIKQTIHQAGVPNRNGHVYSKEMIEKAFEKYPKDRPLFVYLYNNSSDYPSDFQCINKVAGNVNTESIKIDEDGVVTADVKILGTPFGKIAQSLLDDSHEVEFCGLNGFGFLNKQTKEVSEFQLASIGLGLKEKK